MERALWRDSAQDSPEIANNQECHQQGPLHCESDKKSPQASVGRCGCREFDQLGGYFALCAATPVPRWKIEDNGSLWVHMRESSGGHRGLLLYAIGTIEPWSSISQRR